MNEAVGKQPEALKLFKVNSESPVAKKQIPNTRFGLGALIGVERRAHQARRARIFEAKTQKALTTVRERNSDTIPNFV